MPKQEYTAGFAFDPSGTPRVLLIHKKRGPEGYRGLLNGIGGKIELGETAARAQQREFLEEAGLDIPAHRWEHTISLHGDFGTVWFFRTVLTPAEAGEAWTVEDEQVGWYDVADLPRLRVVPNVLWLVPLSNDRNIEFPIHIWEVNESAGS